MSHEQDREFFRNFVLVLVGLTVFGFIAAILGRHFAPLADRSQSEISTPASGYVAS